MISFVYRAVVKAITSVVSIASPYVPMRVFSKGMRIRGDNGEGKGG
jgi:hypothetical protein